MNIIIVGCGKVGASLAERLSAENHNLVLVDLNQQKVEELSNRFDAMGVVGNGASFNIQQEAGVESADLFIAVTGADELNLLCCLMAKKSGHCQTIARVRNPVYAEQMHLLRDDLRLSMAVNPEFALAGEIARVLIFPSAAKMEVFAKGRVELAEVLLTEKSAIVGIPLSGLYKKYQIKMLICAVQRGAKVYIPDGNFVLEAGDKIHIAASHKEIEKFFRLTNSMRSQAKNVMICGGGRVAYYLARQLLAIGMHVKIVEQNEARCLELSELLPKATIIHGNATQHELLEEEEIEKADAFVALTGMDEENIIMSMYAKMRGVSKIVTKVNDEGLENMVEQLGMESVVSAKNVTANLITGYVRAMKNSMGSANVETVYKLVGGKIEALGFVIREKTRYTGIPLKDLTLKENHLVACIVRKNQIIIPGGNDTLEAGDNVIVVSMAQGLEDLKDILR